MTKEQKFYNILQDLFVGAKLEGDSGYVNLMNIKTDYFNLIKKRIEDEIKLKFGESKPEDLYDKLYTFFDSYFSDGGSIFFSSTPNYKNIYAKVYSDREDVSLFWKTSKLYYVKSEANYRTIENLQLNSDPEIAFDFHFDASFLKHKQANEKKELQFYFVGSKTRAGKKVVKFRVIYKNDNKYDKLKDILDIKDNTKIIKYVLENSEKLHKKITFKNDGFDLKIVNDKGGREFVKAELLIQDDQDLLGGVNVEPAISDISDIEKYLRLKSIVLNSEDIEKAFKVYKKQTEIDYFIHKDAKGFLREQFDLYMYQYLAGNMETVFDQEHLHQIKKIKEVAYLAIDYIGNFEDELKKIWLKPKFARKSNYVVTLDRLADKAGGMEVIGKIIKHKGIMDQIAEWQELNIIKKDFSQKEIVKAGKLNKDFQTLPIDTKHFKDLEIEIICLFDNLDEALDGRLIKSDNFQALNTLLPKYSGQVQTIYIDPPFNTGDDFEYDDRFQNSTWLTLMDNRLRLANVLLRNDGSFYLHLDENANYIGRMLMDINFGSDKFQREIIWDIQVLSGFKVKGAINRWILGHQSIYFYSKGNDYYFDKLIQPQSYKYLESFNKTDEKGLKYQVAHGRNIYKHEVEDKGKPFGDVWADLKDIINVERPFMDVWKEITSFINMDRPLRSVWSDIMSFQQQPTSSEKTDFDTQKPEKLLERIIKSSTKKDQIVLDYFGGSGTTIVTAQKIGRKWISIEVGNHFYSKLLPRCKKTIFGHSTVVSRENNYDGGGFFKYYELEQYEDVLKKSVYNPTEKELENIDFSLSEKQAKVALDIDLKKETARFVFEKLYPDVDIPETISNLFGKKIKKITKDRVIFEDESEVDLNDLDFEKHEPLKKLIYW